MPHHLNDQMRRGARGSLDDAYLLAFLPIPVNGSSEQLNKLPHRDDQPLMLLLQTLFRPSRENTCPSHINLAEWSGWGPQCPAHWESPSCRRRRPYRALERRPLV